MKTLLSTIFYLMSIAALMAQDNKEGTWDVSTPALSYNEVNISTDEGTWMNLDVSPDGSTIVFDLLGDIYSMPMSGGEATLLRGGHAFEVQPRYSPDGTKISFTSDAGGGDNIWTMNTNATGVKQITDEDFRLVNNAVWSASGEYLYVKKHFSSERSLGAGEIWLYHKTGGKGIQLVKKKNEQQDIGEPWASPDGKYVYHSQDVYPGGKFLYNKDPNSQIYVINRYDLENGKIERVTGGSGGAIRPVLSRKGDRLAFVRRVREKTVLFIHDLATGKEYPIYDELSKDQQEAWAIFGPYVGFNWTPDDKSIVIWSNGKILKINVKNSESTEIPFTVSASHKIVEALRFKNAAYQAKFAAKAIRQSITSPDGRYVVFNAGGFLWKKYLPHGVPERLTNGIDLEFDPAFSSDGKYLVYVTWNDINKGAINRLNVSAQSKIPVKLTDIPGLYREPFFSPLSNKEIVFRKEKGNLDQGYEYTKDPGIYILSDIKVDKKAVESKIKLVSKNGQFPRFSSDGQRIYYQTGGYLFGELTKTLVSVDRNGKDKRVIVKSKYAQKFVPSPDDNWLAFSNLYKVYVAAMPKVGKTLDLDGNSKSLPLVQMSRDAGVGIHWHKDNKDLNWTLGDQYYSGNVQKMMQLDTARNDSIKFSPVRQLGIDLQLTSDSPSGKVAFTGARIITMNGDEVIENGTIILDNNRIDTLGRKEDIVIPADAKVFYIDGKTIMPGLIDVHAHLGQFRYGIPPNKKWEYYANLAYGVTTTHDPSSNTEMVFSMSELVKTGQMVGPRIFSTGTILYGGDGDFKAVINNLEDARSAIRRTKAFGAFSVKSYNQPRREQRQQVIKASHELNIQVVPEGGSTFYHNLSMILDGHTSIEHNLPISPLYDDVIQLFSKSRTTYTPTLIVNYGGLNGEYYFYQKHNVWEEKRLLNFTPRGVIDARSRHRTMVPDKEYDNGHILVSKSCKKLADKGVAVNLGAHGQLQGLGVHWEMWMLSQGGMSNLEVLKASTVNGAEYLGMEDDLGTLETGKLADLIILDKNPLDDIYNSNSVLYTVINGRVYDSETMNEVGTNIRPRSPFYWESNSYSPSGISSGHTHVGCACGE